MSKPMIGICNAQTDEVIVREMTDEEYAQYLESATTEPAE